MVCAKLRYHTKISIRDGESGSRRTPNDWIDDYVTLELRVLLRNTNKNIKEITEEMNFPNQSFLGKYFKEHVGISPSAYRKGK